MHLPHRVTANDYTWGKGGRKGTGTPHRHVTRFRCHVTRFRRHGRAFGGPSRVGCGRGGAGILSTTTTRIADGKEDHPPPHPRWERPHVWWWRNTTWAPHSNHATPSKPSLAGTIAFHSSGPSARRPYRHGVRFLPDVAWGTAMAVDATIQSTRPAPGRGASRCSAPQGRRKALGRGSLPGDLYGASCHAGIL